MKITSFKNPLSGDKGSVTDIWGIWEMVLGVFVLFFVFASGQTLAKKVQDKIPQMDTTIDPIVKTPSNPGPNVSFL